MRRCKVCRSLFAPRSITHKACGPGCALVVAEDERKAKERKADKVRKQALKTRGDHIAEAQKAFNAYVRARDGDMSCISCAVHLASIPKTPGGTFDCGHYRSRGSAPHLRFDERNAHGQCKKCNLYRSGNAVDYRIGLMWRIGIEAVEALEADQTPRKWSVAELIEIKTTYRAKLAQLKQRG